MLCSRGWFAHLRKPNQSNDRCIEQGRINTLPLWCFVVFSPLVKNYNDISDRIMLVAGTSGHRAKQETRECISVGKTTLAETWNFFFFQTICHVVSFQPVSFLKIPDFPDLLHKIQACFLALLRWIAVSLAGWQVWLVEKCVKPSASYTLHANSSWDCSRDTHEDNHSKPMFGNLYKRWSVSNNLRLCYPTLKDTVRI